jgi:hypothetical protein
MNFRIADTFRSSLAKLSLDEQKATKTTVYDLQVDPSRPGLKFHRLDKGKDRNFWSVRVNGDVRIIVHKTASDILICYVDHHDKAYQWGERRRLEKHPKTGAIQLVEIRERVEEIPVFKTVEVVEEKPKPISQPVLNGVSRDNLLQYGVPEDWIEDVLQADQDHILEIAARLPQEAAEAVLDLATGTTPQVAQVAAEEDGFNHPDAQRRFRLFTDEEELALALDYPWEQWTIFLHPSQKRLVEQPYSGPARVTGSAGTGKTVVALHRAVQIAKSFPDASVLLTTFSPALADLLQIKLNRLAGPNSDVAKRIVVNALPDVAAELYRSRFGQFDLADDDFVRTCIEAAITELGSELAPAFVWSEWRLVLDAWQVPEFEDYQTVPRIGRKTRLGGKQRERVWEVCSAVRDRLDKLGKITWATAFGRITESLESEDGSPYQSVVVDEAQDLGVAELRFLAQVGQDRPDSLFFAGDSGQRIFQQPFSWKALGVDIRGRSNRLRVNYRTSHQIRQAADILLPDEVSDVDGNVEERTGTVSVFNGPAPFMAVYKDRDAEIEGVANHLLALLKEGMVADELAVFVRSESQLTRARATFKQAGLEWTELERTSLPPPGKIALSTMHLAKGLEFRAVVVMACDHDVVPLAERIEAAADEYELEETFNTERHLLYVAATRARENLCMTAVAPGSEFLSDMRI